MYCHSFIILINPDNKIDEYDSLIHSFTVRKNQNVSVFVDMEKIFRKYGNVYVTDKYFLLENNELIVRMELEKQNFKNILKSI